jgi:LacI family transcriptional regulator
VCATDVLALGVYQAAAQLGLAMPEDVSVAGVGLHGIWEVLRPRLTALISPAAEMASTALELLVRAIESPEEELSSVVLEASLAWGGSTSSPPVYPRAQ